jgi:RimJ/RimL family protein N-acetyltransferase
MLKSPEIFETQRLHLRPPVLSDAEMIFGSYAQDPEVSKYLIWRPHKSIEETKNFLRHCMQQWEEGSSFSYVILRKSDAQLLGMVEIGVDQFTAGLGYVLAKAHWGQGYMPEALKVLVDWGLAQPGIFRIWAHCDIDNPASARVMEKVGMQREGTLRRNTLHPNVSDEPRDAYCYSTVRGR